MDRNFFRSDFRAGNVAWLDWIAVTLLGLIGFWNLLIQNDLVIGLLALAGGFGFGFVTTLAELGKLGNA